MKKSICKIIKKNSEGSKIEGSGFFCKFDKNNGFEKGMNMLITNNHIVGNDDLKKKQSISIFLNNNSYSAQIYLDNSSRIILTDKKLDYAIIEIIDSDLIEIKSSSNEEGKIITEKKKIKEECNFLEIDSNIAIEKESLKSLYEKEPIYIIHYSNSRELRSSFGVLNIIDRSNEKIYYYCTTEEGSSGSPIFSLESKNVIGLHRESPDKFNFNIGILLKDIIYEFSKYTNNLLKIDCENKKVENLNINN